MPFLNARAHSRSGVAKEAGSVLGNDGNDSDIETEDEWFDNPNADTPKDTSKTSNTAAIEVSSFQVFTDDLLNNIFQIPLWHGSVSAMGSSASAPSTSQPSNDATSQGSSITAPVATQQAHYPWPADTEVVVFPGTSKVLLTIQSPLMRSVFQEAFEHLRASLLFIHAFPDPILTRSMISEALGVVTEAHSPRAANIRNCLELDPDYVSKMCRLVSSFLYFHFEYVLTGALSPAGGFPSSEER